MSENSGRNDPSMKEILGSIRRIINEDNAQGGAANAANADEEEVLDLTEEVGAEEAQRPRLDPSFGAAHEKTEEPETRREPVLGLHSPVPHADQDLPEQSEEPATDATPTEEAPAAYSGAETAVPAEEPAPFPADEVHAEASEESPPPAMSVEPTAAEEPIVAEELVVAEEAGAEAEPAQPEPESAEPGPPQISPREIVSDTTTAATATAIGELTRAMEEKTNKLKLGPGEETISDMVREMLRPMLRDWLDQNLPGIVERIVRREIQKLVDRAEADD